MKALAALAALALALSACRPASGASGDLDARLTEAVEAWRERTPAPAAVAMVSTPEGEHVVVSGTLRRRGGGPVTVDSPFRAASITKLLVATVVVQLREEGRLALDDPAVDHLPAGTPVRQLLAGVTVRDLLAHTSGLPDAGRSEKLNTALLDDPGRTWTVHEVLNIAAGGEREFQPGEAHGYSNTNYLLLGQAIEQVTGRPWQVEVRKRVLDPAGMGASYIAGFEEPIGELVPGYFDLNNDGFTELIPHPWPALETSEGAAGALVSTAPDLVRFMESFAAGKLVPPEVIKEMTSPGPGASRYTGYGLGAEVLRPDLQTEVWGHGGFLPGHRSILWHAPTERVTVVVLTNESRSRPDGLAELLLRRAVES